MTAILPNIVSRLSPQEFLTAVLSHRPAVAVFDCDGTLWEGDAGYGFMEWTLAHGLVSRNVSDWIDSRYRLYKSGSVSELTICGEMVQMYNGLREAEMRKAAVDFFHSQIAPTIFPEMRDLVHSLQSAGAEVWAVSSTNDWVIKEALLGFNIPASRILAVRVEVKAGIVTEKLIDVPTDEGKAASLRRMGVHRPDVVFGNSIHDAAMLEMAACPFAVNPSAQLLEVAERNHWPVYYPKVATPKTA